MSSSAPASPGEPVVVLERDGPVARIVLNRPAQYNAMSTAVLEGLEDSIGAVGGDDTVRVVVLAADGPAFCAGHDYKEVRANLDRDHLEALFARSSAIMKSIVRLPHPVIARVHGLATAAGCQLVASCDLAVASSAARFAVSGVRLGLFCSTPSVALTRNVATKRAFEMLITGDFIDAATAKEFGLINRVVEPERLDDAVAELAVSILSKPAVAVRTGKRLFYQQIEADLDTAYDLAAAEMACNMLDPAAVEGADAFLEKRPPRWPSV
jgi:enoyl-CoA hydratase/carnithine racemase